MANTIRQIANNSLNVSKSDTNYLTDRDGNKVVATVYVGTAGDVCVLPWEAADSNTATTGVNGSAVIYKNVPAGSFIPVACRKIFSTNTTASDFVIQFD